jgi:hypothetical protein
MCMYEKKSKSGRCYESSLVNSITISRKTPLNISGSIGGFDKRKTRGKKISCYCLVITN